MDRPTAFSGLHKRKPVGFGNVHVKREEGLKNLINARRSRRTECFNLRRNIKPDDCDEMEVKEDVKVTDRKKELKEYLLKKKNLKEAQLKKKRPPFIVGIPHHGTSPILKDLTNTKKVQKKIRNPTPKKEVRSQRVTRASTRPRMDMGQNMKKIDSVLSVSKGSKNVKIAKTVNRVQKFPLENKATFTFCASAGSSRPLTSPHTPTVLKRSAKKIFTFRPPIVNKNVHVTKLNSASSTGSTEMLATALNNVEEKELSACPVTDTEPTAPLFLNLENLVEDKFVQETFLNLQTRRSTLRLSNAKHFSPIPGTSQPTPKESAGHRDCLEREKSRLLELANKWQQTAQHNILPQDVIDEVDSVVGQTRLLTKDKFKQFSGLIDQFENLSCSQKVTNDDLVGFWEMMYLQVEALDKKYSELEVLKNNNWTKSDPILKPKKLPAARPKRKPTNTTSSMFREMIKTKRAKASTPTSKIQEEIVTTTPVQTVRKSIIRTPRHSFSPFIAMKISSPSRSAGKVDTTMNSSLPATGPTSEYETKVKTEPLNWPSSLEVNSVQEIQEENQITTPVQKTRNSVSKTRRGSSSCTLIDVKPFTFSGQSAERMDTMVNSSPPTTTPRTDVKIESTDTSSEGNSFEEIGYVTPFRRSLRLKTQTPTPRRCDVCDSPDCYDKCNLGTKNRQPSARKRFQLKPSSLIVPKEFDVEMNSTSSKVRKSARKQTSDTVPKELDDEINSPKFRKPARKLTSEKLSFEGKNVESFEIEEVQNLRRSSRKTRFSKVTFSTSGEGKSTLKLPSTPYVKSGNKTNVPEGN